MTKIISFFNPKGGSGKTTSIYNIAWSLASDLNKKVLMIDADPKCNLTALFFGNQLLYPPNNDSGLNGFLEKFKKDGYGDIHELVAPYFNKDRISVSKCLQHHKNNNLSILFGNVKLSLYEKDLTLAFTTKSTPLNKLPGSFYYSIQKNYSDYDYILIDLGPNLSVINEVILMSSDYFITPIYPDYLSFQSLEYIADSIRFWNEELSIFRDRRLVEGKRIFPESPPKFLGVTIQNNVDFNLSYSFWKDEFYTNIKKNIVDKLINIDMTLDKNNEKIKEVLFGTDLSFLSADIYYTEFLTGISHNNGIPITAIDTETLHEKEELKILKTAKNELLSLTKSLEALIN